MSFCYLVYQYRYSWLAKLMKIQHSLQSYSITTLLLSFSLLFNSTLSLSPLPLSLLVPLPLSLSLNRHYFFILPLTLSLHPPHSPRSHSRHRHSRTRRHSHSQQLCGRYRHPHPGLQFPLRPVTIKLISLCDCEIKFSHSNFGLSL